MFKKIGLYYRTLKHLKPIQIRYRLWYILRDKFYKLIGHSYPQFIPKESQPLELIEGCPSSAVCRLPSKTFTFLNQTHTFEGTINWNFSKYGKLWTYHLNYFDYLHQSDMDKENGLRLIYDFIQQQNIVRDGLEPYPISLRGINWIKFLNAHRISDPQIDQSLYNQYRLLSKNIEYHLMGNHLLENGISMLFGAFYFGDAKLFEKASEILTEQLEEQILPDGAHFERSPMYHLILLNRLLDCFNLIIHNDFTGGNTSDFQSLLKDKISLMLRWLRYVQFSSNDLPVFNDSTNTPPVNPSEVLDYGKRLGFNIPSKNEKNRLGASGYLMIRKPKYELCIDAGKPGPDYIPGHAHCDIFSFVLHVDGVPVLVDPGISTYEEGKTRSFERSTAAHNTVAVVGIEQSEVWKSFRVGRRAQVTILEEDEKNLIASHNGFWNYGLVHKRGFSWRKNRIIIEDRIEGETDHATTAIYHFHPSRRVTDTDNGLIIDDKVILTFENQAEILMGNYHYAHDFNKREEAQCVEVKFEEKLITDIKITNSGSFK